MASITTRRRADGSRAYRADVRVKRNGSVVYQESRTFDRKALARDWSSRRELELQEPGALLRMQHRGVTIEELIDRYLDEFGHSFGRSKRHHLEYLKSFDLAETARYFSPVAWPAPRRCSHIGAIRGGH